MSKGLLLLSGFMILTGCAAFISRGAPPMATVPKVDLNRYMGKWYEIARLNHRFERGLTNVTAEYTRLPDGKVQVVNAGYKESPAGKFSTITGKAWVPNPDEPGRLKVSFFWWFSSDYNIVALDSAYQYALVTGPNRKYLWILSRTHRMDAYIYNDLVELARQNGFPTRDLINVVQEWE